MSILDSSHEPAVVSVRERGYRDVSPAMWSRLASRTEFWQLVEHEIIKVSQPSALGFRLHGTRYVGRATLGELTLECVEKIDGALASLFSFASHGAFRVERMQAPTSHLDALMALLIGQFLNSVRSYVSRGREFAYAAMRNHGSLIGGRIDVTRTLSLRARGLRHLVAFERNTLIHHTEKNRVLYAAIREVERISALVDIDPAIIASARSLGLLFEDCRDPRVLFGARSSLAREAQRLIGVQGTDMDRDMLALAGVVLSHESFGRGAQNPALVPRAWFLSLETLFETGIRRLLADLVALDTSVTRGSDATLPIFDVGPRAYRANPDLVLRHLGLVVAVGDVKYKVWTGAGEASDIYQLLAHAAAFGASSGFLVYPHEHFEAHDLGTSATGCRTWLFAVDVTSPERDLKEIIARLGSSTPITLRTSEPATLA